MLLLFLQSLVDKERIVEDIKKQAFIGASKMRASNRATRKIKGRLNPIDFFCGGNKNDDDVISQAYNESCIQAVWTIVQKGHHTKSVKGKPLN